MSTLMEKRLINASLHSALHKNLYLLSLNYPMSKDLQAVYKEGVFEKPNRVAFHQISYYLMSIIDSKSVASSSSWAILEIKMEVEYRKQFIKFVDNAIQANNGYVSHIVPSWLVNAGGIKVTKLMFELSQLALKIHITDKTLKSIEFDIHSCNPIDVKVKTATLKEALSKKLKWWQTYLQNMDAIAKRYKNYLPKVINDKENKTNLLKSIIEQIKLKTDSSNHQIVDQLGNIFIDCDLIKEWSSNLEMELIQIENSWEKSSSSVVSLAKQCKDKSNKVIERYSKKTSNNDKLVFDPKRDLFRVNYSFESELSSRQSSVVRSTVRNGVLDFPNMLRSYAVVISHVFKTYNPPVICDFVVDLENKKNVVLFIKENLKTLLTELYQFHNHLKSEMPIIEESICERHSCLSPWINKVFHVPSIPKMSIPYDSKTTENWNVCFKHLTFKTYQYPSQDDQLTNNENAVHKLFVEGTAKKPDYLKSIEEIQRNMVKITGSSHNFTMHDVSMKSCFNATDTKHNRFSTNHIQRLLTTAKKNPGVSVHKNRTFHKKFGNLFKASPESSFTLLKTKSSPSLIVENDDSLKNSSLHNRRASIKSNERISGVEAIDYTGFKSGLGSLPNLTDTIETKENISTLDSVEESIKVTPDINDSHVTKKCGRKSIDNIIARFQKIKMSAKMDKILSEKKKVVGKEGNGRGSDSFLEELDLGNQHNVEQTSRTMDNVYLSNVPDLLSPSLDLLQS